VLHLAIALGRNFRRRATILQIVADRVAVIPLVRQHRARIAVALLHQRIVGRHIMGFTWRQYDTHGKADGIAAEVDLGGEPAARTAECLKLNPAFFTGGTAMRPDRGAVDHLQRVQLTAAIRQPLQQDVPRTRLTPAAELPPDRIPVAECLRQVAPWYASAADPENTIQHPPMVGWRAPATQRGGGNERLDDRPFLVCHQTAKHSQPP